MIIIPKRNCGVIKMKDSKGSAYGMIAIGTFSMALGINLVYQPMSMVTGGFTGVGLLLQHFFPIPLWVVTLVLNIPLFLLAGNIFGWYYVRKTIFASLCLTGFLAVIPQFPIQHEDYLMAALSGGALNGVGLGLVFRRGASTGGTDLLSNLLQKWFPQLNTATVLGVIDAILVVAGMIVFGIRIGLYSIVAVVVTTKLMDRMIEGVKFAKLLYIVSDQAEEISREILEKMHRGVTALAGKGMYSAHEKNVLLCAISRKELVKVRRLVKGIDSRAFIIISDVREIMGEGFGTDFMQNTQKK